MSSPNMDAAMAALAKVQADLNRTDGSNKGIFLPRAKADLVFTMDNTNAAINLANGLPASQPMAAANPGALAPTGLDPAMPLGELTTSEIGGALLVAVVLLGIVIEQYLRSRGRR
jgi:hypothetical protein